ncbi:MAG TPA: alpha/beta fold hydrolase [Allosphingosinicella sp.]|nr:alpha/beta fold hydrolase [Allosphingosinicella sp.]
MLPLLLAAALAAAPVETAVEAPGPYGPLKGTMLAPAGTPRATILIVPGSGPTDRDGNSPLGVRAAPYKLLVEGLAGRGIATVRIDKRGMFASAGAIPDANQVTVADYATDVHAWAKAIRARTGAHCLWVLGHSEGALIALAAAQDRTDLCGVILVSGGGRRLGDVIRDQLRANPANALILPQAMAALDALEAGRKVDTNGMNPALLPLFNPRVQGFLISLFSCDPAALIAKLRLPALIVQGERDLQVSVGDARRLAAADPAAKLVLLPDVNHVLKTVASDERNVNFATYADPSLPLAPGIVEAIAGFVAPPPRR